jgi:hypothetical protein
MEDARIAPQLVEEAGDEDAGRRSAAAALLRLDDRQPR